MLNQEIKATKITLPLGIEFTSGNSKSAFCLINEKGEFGFLPGNDKPGPYMPFGGRNALKEVKDVLVFQAFEFTQGTTIGKAIKI